MALATTKKKKVSSSEAPSSVSGLLKSLTLQNWQGYVSENISFSPGVTVIVGASNSGKSSIVRALRRVIRDEGPSAVRDGATTTTISLECSGGSVERELKVRRSPGKKPQLAENAYRVNGEEFKAVGNEIPSEALQVHGLGGGVLKEYGIDLHFGNQHDSIYLLQAAPSVRSKVLAKLSGVEILDRAVTIENSRLRQLKDEEVTSLQIVANCEKILEECKQVDSWKRLLDSVDKDAEELASQEEIYYTRKDKYERFLECRDQRRELKRKESVYAESALPDLQKRVERLQRIQGLLDQMQQGEQEVEAVKKRHTGAKQSTINSLEALERYIERNPSCPTCGQELTDSARQYLIRG